MKKSIPTTALNLQANSAKRLTEGTAQIGMALLTAPAKPDRMAEWQALNRAAMERAGTLQKSWMQGWLDWVDYTETLAGADTVPKFMERVGNIGLRAQAQMVKQVNDSAELLDNVFVSFSWWAAQQMEKDG